MKKRINQKSVMAMFLTLFFIMGFLPVNLNAKGYVYVDDDASGEKTGSYSHPFKKIQDAIEEAQKEGKNVTIRKGTYVENIVIRSNVEIYGSDRDEVIIKAKKDSEPVVEMHDDTKISKVTIRDGKYGIIVNEDDSAIISDCKVINNDKDGIKAKRASRSTKHKLEIYDSFIAYNGWNGIFSERRKANIKNNQIYFNDRDGVEFEKKSEVTFEDNRVKENDGVGLKLTVDGSGIWVKDNTFYNNDKQGIEIQTRGEYGKVELRKNKFYKNDSWGIIRINRASFTDSAWNNSFKILEGNTFWDNGDGAISPIVNIY